MVFWQGIVSVILFYILILAVGIWAAKKIKPVQDGQSRSEDLMLAGRDIGLFVGICTMTATWVGGGYINGTAEAVFSPNVGLMWTQAPFGYSISLVIGGYFFAGKMREAGYVTMLDPFQKKFGERMGGCMFIPALMGEIFWTSAILAALGSTISVIVGSGNTVSIVVSAAIAVMYTTFGGLYSVAYTDVVQLICTFFGLWISIPFAMNGPGVQSISQAPYKWSGQLIEKQYIASYMDGYLMIIFGGIPWQVYFQRVLASKTPRRAQFLSYFAGIGCFIMAIPAVLIGAIAASTDWRKTEYLGGKNVTIPAYDYKKVLPLVMRYLCPNVVAFIGLGAVSAAVMSSADSSILSAASMFSRNIVKSIFWNKASDTQVIWIMQMSTLLMGLIACIIGIFVDSVYLLWFLCSDLVYAIIFPQLCCVIYFEKSNTYGSLVGFIVGLFFRVSAGDTGLNIFPLIPYPFYIESINTQLFPCKTFSMLMNLAMVLGVSTLTDYAFRTGIIHKDKDIFKCFEDVIPTNVDNTAMQVVSADSVEVRNLKTEKGVDELSPDERKKVQN